MERSIQGSACKDGSQNSLLTLTGSNEWSFSLHSVTQCHKNVIHQLSISSRTRDRNVSFKLHNFKKRQSKSTNQRQCWKLISSDSKKGRSGIKKTLRPHSPETLGVETMSSGYFSERDETRCCQHQALTYPQSRVCGVESIATRFIEGGHDLVKVQRAIGHADVQTTARYDRQGEKDLKEVARDVRL